MRTTEGDLHKVLDTPFFSVIWHTFPMKFSFNTYIPGTSIVHRCDARVKFMLLLAYSLTLFFVQSWMGLLLCSFACLLLCGLAQIPLSRLFGLLIPLYVILIFTLVFNSFSFDVYHTGQFSGWGDVSAGVLGAFDPLPLFGSFGFIPAGFARGCFYALRITFLVVASLMVSFTTSSTELIDALSDFLRPLRALRVPTEDIAMIISIALRFIPVTAEELARIHAAQQSRGAVFDQGGLLRRVRAWQPVMIPLFVGLFRRANNLALAMEARCYGMLLHRTRLRPRPFSLASSTVLTLGVILCVTCGVLL